MALSVAVGYTLNLVKSKYDFPNYYISMPVVAMVLIFAIVHYKLSLKYPYAAQLFPSLQGLIVMVVGLEVSIMAGGT